MDEGAGEAGQLGGSLIVECGDAGNGQSWVIKLGRDILVVVVGFVLANWGSGRYQLCVAKKSIKEEAGDLAKYSSDSAIAYCVTWDKLCRCLEGMRNDTGLVNVPYLYHKPMKLLYMQKNPEVIVRKGDPAFRRALRLCLVKHEECEISVRDFEDGYIKVSRMSQPELEKRIEEVKNVIRNFSMLWSHAKDVERGGAEFQSSPVSEEEMAIQVDAIMERAEAAFGRRLPRFE